MEEPGDYRLKVFYCKSWDYGVVELYLDGKKVGDPFDGYSPNITSSGPVDYGTVNLGAGQHRLKFLLSGKNEESTGYYLGIDALVLEKE